MECTNSAENLNSRRDSNNYRSSREISPGVCVHANSKHVMRPDNESEDANCEHCVDHAQNPKRLLFPPFLPHNVRHQSEPGENKNINLGMAKKSKQVLI